jgi:hypothetical protein
MNKKMVSQELLEYVKTLMVKGYSTILIYNHLVKYGYSPDDASLAITMAGGNPQGTQIPVNASTKQPTPEFDKKLDRKPVNLWPFLLISALILAIAGGAFLFSEPLKEYINKIAPSNNALNPGTTSGQEPSQNPTQELLLKEDCGFVDNTRLFISSEERTEAEVQAMSCFSRNLLGCRPSMFELSGENGVSYEIIGKEGYTCLMSSRGKTCKLPVDYIQKIQDRADQEGAPEMAFLASIFVFSMGNPLDAETGATIVIECY